MPLEPDDVHPEALFLPSSAPRTGRRYALFHAPQGTVRGAVVYVHPFAEEMNKARRMAALQSRALAAAGYAVLQIDLLGCGDSDGDFADASWPAWIDDVTDAARWLERRVAAPLWFWGLRAGCLLAAEAARVAPVRGLLLWQPPVLGKPLLQQFLRLKLVGDMVGGGAKVSIDALRARLAAGDAVEIAGYDLAPALAQGLDAAALAPPEYAGRLAWLEVSMRDDAGLSSAAAAALAGWQRAGWALRSAPVRGPAFWQTVEIEEAPLLLPATLGLVAALDADAVPPTLPAALAESLEAAERQPVAM